MASSAGGSELFSSYEQDFTSVTDSIKIKIEQQIPNQKGGKERSCIYLEAYGKFCVLKLTINRGEKSNYSSS